MTTSSRSIVRITVFATLTLVASAAEWIVRPGPSAIAQAIGRAAEGDVLVLQPGVYRERVRIEKPLTLRAMPGAIMDGAEELRADWKAEGDGIFTASHKSRPDGLLADGRFIAEVRFDRAQTKGDWHWRTLLAKGPPLSGFTQIRALWMYHPQEQRIYVRFENGVSPEKRALTLVPSGEALLTIAKASGVTVEGFTFAGGATAVAITDGATDAVVRRCKVTSYEGTGIVLAGGAARCTVEDCTITRGAFEEWQPSAEHSRPNYEIWRIHKDVGRQDRVGIEIIRAGAGNRILRNKLDRTFDGICLGDYKAESLDKPLTDPAHGRGTEIAENVIENTRDSGIELGTGCTDVNVHQRPAPHTRRLAVQGAAHRPGLRPSQPAHRRRAVQHLVQHGCLARRGLRLSQYDHRRDHGGGGVFVVQCEARFRRTQVAFSQQPRALEGRLFRRLSQCARARFHCDAQHRHRCPHALAAGQITRQRQPLRSHDPV